MIRKLFALLFVCAFSVLLLFDLKNGLIALWATSWDTATGEVVDVEIHRNGNRYVASVIYEFSVNGDRWRGTRYGMLQHNGKRQFRTRNQAESWVAIGTPLTVRFRESDPNQNLVLAGYWRWSLFVIAKTVLLAVAVLYVWPIRDWPR